MKKANLFLSAATFAALSFATGAHAQSAAPRGADAVDSNSSVDMVVVTGSRIVRDGFTAPTPVTVLSAEAIQAQRPPNITDFVQTLPAVTGGSTSKGSAGGLSSGGAGLNSINLRALGPVRTLVLLDGHRTVASSVTGTVDINTFPQDLVERVEVVTGGASAQYGSDAVGGIVNFVLKPDFEGLKLSADTGISDYGDDATYRFAATAGGSFLDDRLHVMSNFEYFREVGVDTIDREWQRNGTVMIRNPNYTATNGLPQFVLASNVGFSNSTAGGLITSGPLRGTHFLGDGQTGQLTFGHTSATSSPWMIGGDWEKTLDGILGTNSLAPDENRIGTFNRVSYDINDNLSVYGQFSWNRWHGRGYFSRVQTNLTVAADNAYLITQYPQVAAAMAANNLASISVGTNNATMPVFGSDNVRQVFRYIGGAEGNFEAFGRNFSFDAYFQHGVAKLDQSLINTTNNARLALASDPVLSNGRIVCRSTLTNPTNGCVPLDRLGTTGVSAAALDYVYNPGQPARQETIKQDVAALTFNTDLFDLPAGPVKVAFGGEWRQEQISGEVDPIYNSGWFYGNYLAQSGKYNVKEAFAEADLPLFTGFTLNAAGRYTDYSVTGSVQTWKLGANYSPIPDIRIRGTYSHDIRAPNLQELFAAGLRGSSLVLLPPSFGTTGPVIVLENTVGNLNLKPESANSWTIGAVVSPRFIPGLTASVDYYDISIKDGIGTVTPQQIIDFCYTGGRQNFCDALIISGGTLQEIIRQPFNFSGQSTRGIDFEASYTLPLSEISQSLAGTLRLHAGVTHYIENIVDNGVFPVDYAGMNGEAFSFSQDYVAPDWGYRISGTYDLDPVRLNLVMRGFNSGVYGNDYVECSTGCPASTNQNRTVNTNRTPGANYLDGSVSFRVPFAGNEGRLSFIVTNILNTDPPRVGAGNSAGGVSTAVGAPITQRRYDFIGRTFRLALEATF